MSKIDREWGVRGLGVIVAVCGVLAPVPAPEPLCLCHSREQTPPPPGAAPSLPLQIVTIPPSLHHIIKGLGFT